MSPAISFTSTGRAGTAAGWSTRPARPPIGALASLFWKRSWVCGLEKNCQQEPLPTRKCPGAVCSEAPRLSVQSSPPPLLSASPPRRPSRASSPASRAPAPAKLSHGTSGERLRIICEHSRPVTAPSGEARHPPIPAFDCEGVLSK